MNFHFAVIDLRIVCCFASLYSIAVVDVAFAITEARGFVPLNWSAFSIVGLNLQISAFNQSSETKVLTLMSRTLLQTCRSSTKGITFALIEIIISSKFDWSWLALKPSLKNYDRQTPPWLAIGYWITIKDGKLKSLNWFSHLLDQFYDPAKLHEKEAINSEFE
ncbi:hypothetical protein T4D_9885 [Trichinella pseudospiralis]|uniref:Uncharacterized protein n=1 Tax=Trichinella pseudospiralis TaxID=6337 RepID=A0A0V1FHL1_TRIPS|nr:hypothetical protein T4D_9885 [Trichinella pseudospiralis]